MNALSTIYSSKPNSSKKSKDPELLSNLHLKYLKQASSFKKFQEIKEIRGSNMLLERRISDIKQRDHRNISYYNLKQSTYKLNAEKNGDLKKEIECKNLNNRNQKISKRLLLKYFICNWQGKEIYPSSNLRRTISKIEHT